MDSFASTPPISISTTLSINSSSSSSTSSSRRRNPASSTSSPYSSRSSSSSSKIKSPAKKSLRIDQNSPVVVGFNGGGGSRRLNSSKIDGVGGGGEDGIVEGDLESYEFGKGLSFAVVSTNNKGKGTKGLSGISTTRPEDVWDLKELMGALPELDVVTTTPPIQSIGEGKSVKTSVKKRKREVNSRGTGIMDLPDEILLQIFSTVHDQDGFRPIHKPSFAAFGPEWHKPPLRLGLVCRRWLPLSRQTFYRNLSIRHFSRILPLYKALVFASPPNSPKNQVDLSLLVRRISIATRVRTIAPAPSSRATSLLALSDSEDELDSNSLDGNETTPLPTPQNQLRAILRSCSNLLRIDVATDSGCDLFSPLDGSKSAAGVSLQHLHLLRFSTVKSLHLTASISDHARITPSNLRAALLALTGLETLSIQGYRSTSREKLDLSRPTTTLGGFMTRSLPIRASKIPLKTLVIRECQFDEKDLRELVKIGVRGMLRTLVVEEVWNGRWATGNAKPTLLALPAIQDCLGGVRILQLGLFNYPIIATGSGIPSPSSEGGPTTATMVDFLLPHLTSIEILDLGGTVCTPSILDQLPPSVKQLTLRGCTTLSPGIMCAFLHSLAQQQASFLHDISSSSQYSARREKRIPGNSIKGTPEWKTHSGLKVLEVFGGATTGWRQGETAWEVQQAAWRAGVTWRGW